MKKCTLDDFDKDYFYAPPPPLKKEGHIALHMLVGRLVGRSVCRYVSIP